MCGMDVPMSYTHIERYVVLSASLSVRILKCTRTSTHLLCNSIFEPSHEIMALRKLIIQTRMRKPSSGDRCLIFGRTLCLLPYFMCANSKGSDETARMRRLA